MPFFKLTLAYDGTGFAGWQWQPRKRTVQGTLEELIERITGTFVRVSGSSRTDAGVHALGQVVSFCSDTNLDCATLRRALNAYAPDDLLVIDIVPAEYDFHATRDAVAKRYRYVIQDGPYRDVFARSFSWRVKHPLDIAFMQQAAEYLVGTHDFNSFQSRGSVRMTTVRTIHEVSVVRAEGYFLQQPVMGQGRVDQTKVDSPPLDAAQQGGTLYIEVQADGFLYNMVRNIAGTLAAVGKHHHSVDWLRNIVDARDRRAAGMTAPAQGLFLLWVKYPDDIQGSEFPCE